MGDRGNTPPRQEEKGGIMVKEAIIFAIGFFCGNVSLACWALCAANTMYEEKRRKVKTSPMLKEEQEKRIDEWLEKEVDPEWRD